MAKSVYGECGGVRNRCQHLKKGVISVCGGRLDGDGSAPKCVRAHIEISPLRHESRNSAWNGKNWCIIFYIGE